MIGIGRSIAFLLYYPAVTLAAFYGGLSAGLLATALSAALVFFWIQAGSTSSVESLAMDGFAATREIPRREAERQTPETEHARIITLKPTR